MSKLDELKKVRNTKILINSCVFTLCFFWIVTT